MKASVRALAFKAMPRPRVSNKTGSNSLYVLRLQLIQAGIENGQQL